MGSSMMPRLSCQLDAAEGRPFRICSVRNLGAAAKVFLSELIVLSNDRAKVWKAQNEIKHQQHGDKSQGERGLLVGIDDRVRPPLLRGFFGAPIRVHGGLILPRLA
jgi:hypothetical protein